MKEKKYLGFCAKYGSKKTWGLAFTAPAIVNALTEATRQTISGAPASNPSLAIALGLLVGGIGVSIAATSHDITNEILNYKQVGLTRGGKIARKVQALGYAVPTVTLILIFNLVSPSNEEHTLEQPNDINHITLKARPTADLVVPQNHLNIEYPDNLL